MRTAKVISLSLPPEMEAEVQKIAKEEHRTISELLREAFRQYLTNRDLSAIRKEGRKVAKKLKLNPEDIAKVVKAGRKQPGHVKSLHRHNSVKESWDWIKDSAKSTKAGYWRTAPIAKAIRPIIAELMQANPESPFLFPRHEEWLRCEQAQVIRKFCEEIGIRSVRFHTLRACFATHMLATGVDQATVMAIGGWSNLKTFRIYVRLAGITERSKTERLGDLFVPARTTLEEHISKTFETTQDAA